METGTILIVDDNKSVLASLELLLENEFGTVRTAANPNQITTLLTTTSIDVVILDMNFSAGINNGNEGLYWLKQIHEIRPSLPVVMLTAKSEDMDKILGLEYGADDYITKPFNILEVKARIKAIMRRTAKRKEEPAGSPVLVKGNMKIDCEGRRVFIGEREINLTAKEFDVLELLAMNPNKVYSRENLLNLIWGYDYPGDARTVDVHIRRLREKIEQNPSEPKYVHTKWGVGYYFQG
mgnify:CR=1 FL=1